MSGPLLYGAFAIVRPVEGCGHINPEDGLCMHPQNLTPECHCAACPLVPNEPCGRYCAACEKEVPKP